MYEPHELLRQIDHHKWWILGLFTVCMTFQWIWLIECVRLARRERVYIMPLFCTFYWFAHDTGCVARFNDWFHVYDHWYLKCFWFGLLTAAILELDLLQPGREVRRSELAPGVGPRTFILGLVMIQIGTSVAWEFFKYVLADPLYQMSPPPTTISYPLLGLALMLRRRSTIGQNVTMWAAFTGMCIFWFPTAIAFYGKGFHSWQYAAAGAVSVAGGLLMTYLVSDRSTLFQRVPLASASPVQGVQAAASVS